MGAQVDGHAAINGLRRLSAGIREASQLILVAAEKAAESNAKATRLWKDQHPSDGTRSTIKGVVTGFGTATVTAGGAAKFLDEGTKAHAIMAKNGASLRFFVNGQAVFRRRVWLKAQAPRPFMQQARDHAEHTVPYAAEIYVNEAIARA